MFKWLKKDWDKYVDSKNRTNHWIPYITVVTYSIATIITPISEDKLIRYSGYLSKYGYETDGSNFEIFLKNNKKTFMPGWPRHRDSLRKIFPYYKNRDMEIWSQEIEIWTTYKKSPYICKMNINGKAIIEYSWWWEVHVYLIAVAIGAILAPIGTRSYRKFRKKELEEEEKAFRERVRVATEEEKRLKQARKAKQNSENTEMKPGTSLKIGERFGGRIRRNF